MIVTITVTKQTDLTDADEIAQSHNCQVWVRTLVDNNDVVLGVFDPTGEFYPTEYYDNHPDVLH